LTDVPDIPVPLKAVQIARDMMGFDPLWAEAMLLSQASFAAAIGDRPDRFSAWIPLRIAGRPGFIRMEEDGLSGEYHSLLEPDEKILDMAPVAIEPTSPVTLQQMLRDQLAVWTVEPRQEAIHAGITRLADPAFVPMQPRLRDVLASLAEDAAAGLEGLKQRNQRLAADSTQAFMQLELCGREFALVMAFSTLVKTVIDAARDARDNAGWDRDAATILLRGIAWGPEPTSEASLAMLLDSMGAAQRSPVILECVKQFEAHANRGFEEAKSVGVDAEASAEQAAERVCADFGYAMALWSDMHHALRGALPFAYAGQVLARFLVNRVALPAEHSERMRSAYKQLDELTVIIMTSLAHAVRMHDPRMRAAKMMQIRKAREQGGARAARAVVRSLTEQQAFYPRAWARWLGEASQSSH
jgi:hypothetical protein